MSLVSSARHRHSDYANRLIIQHWLICNTRYPPDAIFIGDMMPQQQMNSLGFRVVSNGRGQMLMHIVAHDRQFRTLHFCMLWPPLTNGIAYIVYISSTDSAPTNKIRNGTDCHGEDESCAAPMPHWTDRCPVVLTRENSSTAGRRQSIQSVARRTGFDRTGSRGRRRRGTNINQVYMYILCV